MRYRNKRFLILGANGYVGRSLSQLLIDAGCEVHQLNGSSLRRRVIPVGCDDTPDLIVVNCAFWDGLREDEFNMPGYISLVHFYGEQFSNSIHVFLSSSHVYQDNQLAHEKSELDKTLLYSRCKLETELCYELYVKKFVIFRIGQVLDREPKPKTFFAYVLNNIDSNSSVFSLERCSARLSITLVPTLTETLLLLTERHLNNIYNISSGINLTAVEFVERILATASVNKEIRCIDHRVVGTWMDITKAQNSGLLPLNSGISSKIYANFLNGVY